MIENAKSIAFEKRVCKFAKWVNLILICKFCKGTRCFEEKYFYTTAGRNGCDKFQVQYCWQFGKTI